jgi:ubiquinone/menaquinone biosynthesis C-methylase UbiE
MDCHANKVEKQFGTVAERYLSSSVHSEGADLTAIADKVKTTPRAKVLDLGCGAGHVSFVLAPFVESAIAYDLSREMIGQQRSQTTKSSQYLYQARPGRSASLRGRQFRLGVHTLQRSSLDRHSQSIP